MTDRPRVVVVQHTARAHLGVLSPALAAAADLLVLRGFADPSGTRRLVRTLVEDGEYDAVVLLGGAMAVHDREEFGFLDDSLHLAEDALRRDRPILGLCLGSQILAHVLGSPSFPGAELGLPRELGFVPLILDDGAEADPVASLFSPPEPVLEWHRDTFELPAGTVRLAHSLLYPVQLFRSGRWAYGAQFHPEVDAAMLETLGPGERRDAGGGGVRPLGVAGRSPPAGRGHPPPGDGPCPDLRRLGGGGPPRAARLAPSTYYRMRRARTHARARERKRREMAHPLVEALSTMKEKDALRIVDEELAKGTKPEDILALCSEAMQVVGDRFSSGEYFLPELIMSGEMLKKIGAVLKPHMVSAEAGSGKKLGKVVLGTVRGDIHDIGKDLVGFILDVNGFEVIDLGINVPEERFVEAVRDNKPQVLALSGFLSVAFDSMKSTVEQIEAAGLRDGMRIIIGGGQMDDTVRDFVKADAYGESAMDAVAYAKEAVGVA